MAIRATAYTVIGIASAAVVAVLTAPYRAIDISVVAFSAMMVGAYCLRKAELPPWLKITKPEVRSRVFRYAELAKTGARDPSKNWVINDKQSLFSATELRNLPHKELVELEAKLRAAE